jgi:hypothetical protein
VINNSQLFQVWQTVIQSRPDLTLEAVSALYSETKNPDEGTNFNRHFTLLEAPSVIAASQVASFLVNNLEQASLYRQRIDSIFSSLLLQPFSKVVFLPGSHKLANGDVLKAQIHLLPPKERRKIAIFCSSINRAECDILSSSYGCQWVGGVEGYKLLDRMILAAYFCILYCNPSELIWWSAPSELTFLFTLFTNIFRYEKPGQSLPLRSWATVKHHASFSLDYLDCIYTTLPSIQKSSTGGQEIKKLSTFMYSYASLLPSPDKKKIHSLEPLYNLKEQGFMLVSSVSRPEKTDFMDYIQVLSQILAENQKVIVLLFGRQVTKSQQALLKLYPKQCMHCGWRSDVIEILSLLDLFLDPFPFGAGMTMASAAAQGIPIISTADYVDQSPSTISILWQSVTDDTVTMSSNLRELLFGPRGTYAQRALNLLGDLSNATATIIEMQQLCKTILSDPSSQLSLFDDSNL